MIEHEITPMLEQNKRHDGRRAKTIRSDAGCSRCARKAEEAQHARCGHICSENTALLPFYQHIGSGSSNFVLKAKQSLLF
ncbi:hypothetical protein AruPA_08960 [Acidiphilium sp. PA]|uniref:hypothetical protein n=1 Tax=Acidiphilium sp. PA TaxID=2871705 RepID=UPI002243B6A9|nr:hypothetical protein [Acidiphilium sp. PA]MCW8307162.1 hypothetical protein [Acidiphilium sp. PA]